MARVRTNWGISSSRIGPHATTARPVRSTRKKQDSIMPRPILFFILGLSITIMLGAAAATVDGAPVETQVAHDHVTFTLPIVLGGLGTTIIVTAMIMAKWTRAEVKQEEILRRLRKLERRDEAGEHPGFIPPDMNES